MRLYRASRRELFARLDQRAVRRGVAREMWPLFTSDALRPDAPVLLEVFGTCVGLCPKNRHGRRVVHVTRRVMCSAPDNVLTRTQGLRRSNGRKGTINTAYVERHTLTLREENGRLSRKTLAFSKQQRDLQCHLH